MSLPSLLVYLSASGLGSSAAMDEGDCESPPSGCLSCIAVTREIRCICHVAGCPLCMEDMDVTDKNFRPCKCGYQICLFCYNKIKDNHNGACPACRRGRALCLRAPHSASQPLTWDFFLPFTGRHMMRPMPSLSRQTLLSALLQIHRNLATRPSPPKRFVAINKALHLCSWRNLFPAILQDG